MWCESWTITKAECQRTDVLNCGVGEDSWESLGLQGDPTSPFWSRSTLNVHWKDWCWSWSSSISATWCKEPTHWKRLWCWERLRAEEEGDDRGWDGWMAPSTLDMSLSKLWAIGKDKKPGMLQSVGLQRVRHDWATELNWSCYLRGKEQKKRYTSNNGRKSDNWDR